MEDGGAVRLSRPLLQYSNSYEDQHKNLLGSLQTGKHGLLAAAASHTGLSYARTRSLLRQRETRKAKEPTESIIWKVLMWPIIKLKEIERFKSPVTLPVKAGLAALIAGLLCFAPGFLRPLNKNGVWAVITVDIVLETNVGLTFSKGVNRTLGTSLAAALALAVDIIGNLLGAYENHFLLFCTFLGGAIPTVFKFRQPFKDRWNYAVVMSMITFHLLILTQSDHNSKMRLPIIRFATIAIGFVIATVVNVVLLPNFAGNNVNNLLATNFERAGNVVEKCVQVYCRGTVLDDFPDTLRHAANDDLHASFHEILSTDSELEKLLTAAKFEPPHGKFFFRYPWHLYEEVSENLRFAFYDVVALDACLRAEIQAPLNLRGMFEIEFLALGKECADVFRTLARMMRNMEHVDSQQILERAEEVAILLQHNIAKYADVLLGGAPCPAVSQKNDLSHDTGRSLAGFLHMTHVPSEPSDNNPHGWSYPETVYEGNPDMHRPEQQQEQYDLNLLFICGSVELWEVEEKKVQWMIGSLFLTTLMKGSQESAKTFLVYRREDTDQKENKIKQKGPKLEGRAGEFLKRRGSISDHWDLTVQRLAALSLLKFASILIEIAAKAKFLVSVVDDLSVKARFDHSELGHSKSSAEFDSLFGSV